MNHFCSNCLIAINPIVNYPNPLMELSHSYHMMCSIVICIVIKYLDIPSIVLKVYAKKISVICSLRILNCRNVRQTIRQIMCYTENEKNPQKPVLNKVQNRNNLFGNNPGLSRNRICFRKIFVCVLTSDCLLPLCKNNENYQSRL